MKFPAPPCSSPRKYPISLRAAHGAALIVSLILLTVVTIMGVASMRGVTMQERMSSNMYDRSLGFQAAESALRAIEQPAVLNAASYPADLPTAQYEDNDCDATTCVNGYCPRPDPECTDRWRDSAFNGWTNLPTAWLPTTALSDFITDRPQFFSEHMGQAPNWLDCEKLVPMHANCMGERFRATTRQQENADRASVMLQTTFAQ
ncbi:MAG: PilX N-terminal domain-containing pilus assembly protein [Pseudomonadota bacterium]